jgi:hypothetical protein
LSNIWGLAGNFVVTPSNGDTVLDQAGNAFNNLAWLDEAEATIGYIDDDLGAHEIGKRYLTRRDSATLTVGDVVGALCLKSGLEVSDYDVSELTDSIRGYMIPRPMPARDAITVLAAAYLFDAAVIDDVLYFRKRGGATVATVAYADMVRENPDESIIEEERTQDAEIPREITVRFPDFDRGWEPGAQSWSRPLSPTATMAGRGSAALDLAIPMTADEAKGIARRMCVAAWRERTRFTFSVGPKHARIVPTDPILVGTRDGATIRVRVTAVDDGANWVRRIEGVTEDAAAYDLTATADGGGYWDAPTIPAPYYTRMVYANLPLIYDSDDLDQAALREYAIAAAYDGANWGGVTVYRSTDSITYSDLGTIAGDGAPWGTVTAIPDPPASPWVWDEVGELVVRMTDGEPDSATEAEVLNWANLGALIDGDGNAELIQWKTATDNGDGTFTLTSLLRGRRGTEDLIDSRAIGNMFVILDESVLGYSDTTTSDTSTRYMRAASVFDTADTARPTIQKSLRGRAEQPYAVCQIEVTRDGSDNISVDFLRRTRVGGEWLDGTGDVPLAEATESYEMDILAGLPERYAPVYDASSEFGAGYPASNAFNGGTTGFPWAAISGSGEWLRITYAYGVKLLRYSIQAREDGFTSQTPQDFEFQGRFSGGSWVTLDSQTGETGWSLGEIREYSADASLADYFDEYRLYITADNGGGVAAVEEFRVYGGATSGPNLAVTAGTVVRTITGSSAPLAYSAANQTTDFGGVVEEGSAFAIIYQISAIVDRGIAAEVTL